MSAAILTLGKLTFAAVGVAVGIQLAATVRDRGAFGLHSVALAAICTGALGLLIMPFASLVASFEMLILAEAGVRLGMLLLCVFITGTFRPNVVGVMAGTTAAVFLVCAVIWDVRSQGVVTTYDYSLPSSYVNQLSIAVPFVWATIESLVLWSKGRRRLALGLADAAVVNSYLTWATTTTCFVGITVLAMFAGWAGEAGHPLIAEIAQGSRGLLYLVISSAIWKGLFQTPAVEPTEDGIA